MIEIVKALLEKGFAYETDDGIYFSVEKFPEYGKLSGINLDEQKSGARVEVKRAKKASRRLRAVEKKRPQTTLCSGTARGGWVSPAGT